MTAHDTRTRYGVFIVFRKCCVILYSIQVSKCLISCLYAETTDFIADFLSVYTRCNSNGMTVSSEFYKAKVTA
jgi:hypothetical protein